MSSKETVELFTAHTRLDIPESASYFCGVCKTAHILYRHSFRKYLATFLVRLFDAGGVAKSSELGGGNTQYTNCAKNRYWGLIVPHTNEESLIKKGWWEITDHGRDFVVGAVKIYHTVKVRDDEILGFEGRLISFTEALEDYAYHSDYAVQYRTEREHAVKIGS